MKNYLFTTALSFLLIFSTLAAFGQCKEVTWPEDPTLRAKAEESKVLYEDANRAGNVKQAAAPLNWLLANVPEFHISLYINGAEVYDKLATQEKDPARRQVYIDSLMIIYDMRMKFCADEANVTNRKALAFLKFNYSTKPAETLELLNKAIDLNGANFMDGAIVPYMQVLRLNAVNLKNQTDEQILGQYDKIMGVLDDKIKKAQSEGKPVDKYKKNKDDIDALLIIMIKVDCEFVKKNLEPKFKADKTDLALAKKIFSFMLQGKCTDDPLWLESGEAILKGSEDKDCGLAKNLGIKYLAQGNLEKAEALLKEAVTICTDKDKGESLIYLGSIEARKNNRTGARELYRQAAAADAGIAKEAYEKIGDLYYNSGNDCAKGVNQADDRLIYLLAYDYYQKSGDAKKMAMAKTAFPSKEDIFLVNYQSGETKSVGCWTGESTTIRTRD